MNRKTAFGGGLFFLSKKFRNKKKYSFLVSSFSLFIEDFHVLFSFEDTHLDLPFKNNIELVPHIILVEEGLVFFEFLEFKMLKNAFKKSKSIVLAYPSQF